MRNTINVEKLTRKDINTDRLQEIALLLIKTLYNRADEDYGEICADPGNSKESEQKAIERRDAIKSVYEGLKTIPLRGEKWRYRLL